MIKPDIFKRILLMFIIMFAWGIFASLLIVVLGFALKSFFVFFAVISGILFFWAMLYQMRYGFGQDTFSRLILAISGMVMVWSTVVLFGDYGINPELASIEKMSPRLLISAGINGFLFVSLLFFPIFSLKVRPGKYYLISDFGQADHDFDFDYIPFQREGDTQHPGSLISRSRRRWIRPLDTAHIVWESNHPVIVKKILEDVPMQFGYPANFELHASFMFDPLKITDANFAFTLSGQKTISDVNKALQNITNIRLGGVLRVLFYNIPHGQETHPQIIKELGIKIKEALADMENSMGLSFNENSITMKRIVAATASAQEPDYFRTLDANRLQKITYDARQGDTISRFLLYMYLVQNPDLCYQFLPDISGNLRITDVDYLLNRMKTDQRFEEAFMSGVYNTLSQMGAFSPPESVSGLLMSQNPQQPYAAALPSVTHQPPQIEHPEITFSCTNNRTVLISWRGLSGEMYLYLDGYSVGPFYNEQDNYDTQQETIHNIEYLWGGQHISCGSHTCRSSAPLPNIQPPLQSNTPLQNSPRQFGPASDTVETRRNADGSYEPDN